MLRQAIANCFKKSGFKDENEEIAEEAVEVDLNEDANNLEALKEMLGLPT